MANYCRAGIKSLRGTALIFSRKPLQIKYIFSAEFYFATDFFKVKLAEIYLPRVGNIDV